MSMTSQISTSFTCEQTKDELIKCVVLFLFLLQSQSRLILNRAREWVVLYVFSELSECMYLSMAALKYNCKCAMSNQISSIILIIAHMHGAAILMWIHLRCTQLLKCHEPKCWVVFFFFWISFDIDKMLILFVCYGNNKFFSPKWINRTPTFKKKKKKCETGYKICKQKTKQKKTQELSFKLQISTFLLYIKNVSSTWTHCSIHRFIDNHLFSVFFIDCVACHQIYTRHNISVLIFLFIETRF